MYKAAAAAEVMFACEQTYSFSDVSFDDKSNRRGASYRCHIPQTSLYGVRHSSEIVSLL